MRPPIKLSAIDQEHLQELYDSIGVARDELPYTEAFDRLWLGFQDRTFKNAEREQLYVAICKHVRSSTVAAKGPGEGGAAPLSDEELKQLKLLLPRHAKGGKLLPYSDEFEAARKEFGRAVNREIEGADFWKAVCRAQGAKRVPPPRRAKVAAGRDEDGGDDE
jgi:hypothetical protein